MKTYFKVLLVILAIALLVGCEDPNLGKSSKRMAQERLLNELDNCDTKFGSDSESRRQMSQEYCSEVLDRVDSLIREGYFEDDEETKKVLNKAEEENITISDRNKEIEDAQKELDDMYNDIAGDI